MRHQLRTTLTIAALLPAMAALGLVTACTSASPEDRTLRLESDDALETALVDHWKAGGRVTLASLTSFPWDAVRVYPEGTKGAEINGFLGTEVIRDKYYANSTNLFVFSKGGHPVKLVMISADNLDNGVYRKDWPAAVKVEVGQPGQGLTTFVA